MLFNITKKLAVAALKENNTIDFFFWDGPGRFIETSWKNSDHVVKIEQDT